MVRMWQRWAHLYQGRGESWELIKPRRTHTMASLAEKVQGLDAPNGYAKPSEARP
jgi:hypothetical protein